MAREWPARIKKCEYCGNEYVYRASNSRYCSVTCRNRRNNERKKEKNNVIDEAYKAKRKEQKLKGEERKKKDKTSLQKKINAAREAGMSYGKYVAMLERNSK